MTDNTLNLADYISVLVRWRKLIIINFVIFTFSTALISLLMPKTFTAQTTILPPSEGSDPLGLSGLTTDLPFAGLFSGSLAGETNTFLAILNSRTLMQSIAEEFNLMKLFETENIEETVKALREHVSINVNDDATITVFASAKTGFFAYSEKEKNKARNLARDITNVFIKKLDRINTKLKIEKAQNNRIFIEKRYLQNLVDLQEAEEELKTFQETYGVIALPEQTEIAIGAAAELNAMITAKEVEVAVLSQYVSEKHAELSRAKYELNELVKKFDEMKSGKIDVIADEKNGKNKANNIELFIPLNDVPDLGLKYLRFFREVKLQQKIQEFLLPQYEQAKIQEAKDTPTVQILDKAIAPIKRSSPKRTLMVLFGGFLSLLMSVCLIFIFEYFNKIKVERGEDYTKINKAFSLIKRDLRFRSNN